MALLVFDLDGTLVDIDDKFNESLRLSLSEKLNKPITLEEVKSKLAPRFPLLFANFGFTQKSEVSDCIKLFASHWLKLSNMTLELYPGVQNLLTSCKEQGFKMVIWTARDSSTVHDTLKSVGISDLFQDVFCYSNETGGKPVPDSNLLKLANHHTEKCALIGDTDTDAAAAKQIGARFYRAAWKAKNKALEGYQYPERCKIDLLNDFNVH